MLPVSFRMDLFIKFVWIFDAYLLLYSSRV